MSEANIAGRTRAFTGGDAAQGYRRRVLNVRLLDRIEQVILVGLFAFLCWRLGFAALTSGYWHHLMLLLSESTVLLFGLIRRPSDRITVRPSEWIVAFGATVAPLLVTSGSEPFLPEAGLMLMMAGWVIHLGAKLTLRRSFGIVPAHRGIKTDGLYAIVRHPMYLGYLLSHVGFLLAAPSVGSILAYSVAWVLFAVRMLAEERILSSDPAYQAYCAKVRYRLLRWVW